MFAVLFDIDGTLIQTGGAGQLAFAETFAVEFGVPEISAAVKFAGRSDRAIALELLEVHGLEPSDENWRRFRSTYVRHLPDALRRRPGRVLPGVIELLDGLASLPYSAVGLLTGNIRAGAAKKLAHYGLADRFAFGGFGDDASDRNVIAATALEEATRHAAQRNGRHAPALFGAMVIGDTEHDIRCARSIGAVAVAVPTGGASREALAAERPDVLVDSLADSSPLLQIVADAAAA